MKFLGKTNFFLLSNKIKNLLQNVFNYNRFKIKPTYAFGTKGNEQFNIPPNATVEYTIKLNDCEKVMDDWRYSKEERFEHAKIDL